MSLFISTSWNKEVKEMDDGQRKEVMNVEEASRFLGVNPWTLRAEARLGRIPARKIGKEWRFSRVALLNWLNGPQQNEGEKK